MSRTTLTRSLWTSLLLLAVAGLAVPLSAQPKYVVNDLGTLRGGSTTGSGINSSGQVVGFDTSTGAWRAFRTAPNSQINPATDDLGTLGGVMVAGWAINDNGQAAGAMGDTPQSLSYTRGFRTAANAAINPATDDLGVSGVAGSSVARGINSFGQVVGSATFLGTSPQAFRTAANTAINPATDKLGSLGGEYSEALGINNSGQAVGYSNLTLFGVPSHAFRTSPNAAINRATDDLGTFGGTRSAAVAINNSGQAVGYATFSGELVTHAFRTAPNASINPATDDLGTLGGFFSQGQSINTAGDVVGTSLRADNNFMRTHAFVYTGGVLYDLNNQLHDASGWELLIATGINDAGQIAGTGIHNGAYHAFRLDPYVTPVDILVNPGTPRPASFNIDSEGAIPVAILGSATFDVTTIDPTSVQFGPKGAKSSRTPVVQDVNHDGKLDLVLYFSPHSAGIGCTDTSVALIGTTHSKQLLFTGSEAIKTTHTFPCQRCTSTFSDNFNRADGVVGNGWSDTAGNRNGNLVIRNGALSTPGPDGGAGIHRPINLSGPVTVSATLTQENGFGGLLKRYSLSFGFGPFDVGFGRGDQNYNDSRVIINGTQLFSPFQFGSSLAVTITLNPDGSVKGSVSGSGNTFDFGAGPQTVVVPGPDFAIGLDFPDSRSGVITNATVDNLTIAYACGT